MGIYQPNSSSKKLYEKIDNFVGGINIVDESNKLRDNEFRNLENISLIENGSVKKRTGYKPIFNFRECPYFDYIFNPTTTPLHFEIAADFPTDWNQEKDNSNQMLDIFNFVKPFRLVGIQSFKIKLTYELPIGDTIKKENLKASDFIILNVGTETIKNSYWNTDNFTLTDLDPNNETLSSQLDLNSFTIQKPPLEIDIDGLKLDVESPEYNTKIKSSDETTHTISISVGNQITPIVVDFPISNWSDIKNPKWVVDITTISDPKPETLSIEKYEEVYGLSQSELLGYIIAYTYDNNLWFIYFELKTQTYLFLDWYLIDDRIPTDKVNQYRFLKNADQTYSLANLVKNVSFYFYPNDLTLKENYPYKGVDIKNYRGNIYITTGYGLLECSVQDIQNKQLFEIIPFKPSADSYQENYANILALNLRTTDQLKFDELWNWDWIDYPDISHLSGILTKFPPNSKYPTILRCIINFSDVQMVTKWQYQWRWVAPQEAFNSGGTPTGDSMPIISDYASGNFELTWKPIVRNETINTYVVTDPKIITANNPLSTSIPIVYSGDANIQNDNYYLGAASGSQGGAIKFDISTIVTELKNTQDEFKAIDFTGNINFSLTTHLSFGITSGFVQNNYFDNFRIEVTVNGVPMDSDESQGYPSKKGLWKIVAQRVEWPDEHITSGTFHWTNKNIGFKIVNSDAFLKALITASKAGSSGDNVIRILCTRGFYQNAIFNGITSYLTIDPGTTEQNPIGLVLVLQYEKVNPADSNSLGLVPVKNLENLLNINYLQYIKECTELTVIKDQLFLWGSQSAPHLVWYCQPFTPGYFPVINTIPLRRFANEIVKTIEPFGQNYLIFTDRTVYIMSFGNNGDITINIGNPNYGIQYKNSVVGVGNNIIFLSYDGIYLIRSTGMDINNSIKIDPIDLKIRGIFDIQNLKYATACSLGEVYYLTLIDINNNKVMLVYYSLKKVWVQYTTNNSFNFKQMQTYRGSIFTLTNTGILNQWYTQLEEYYLLKRKNNNEEGNKFLLDVMKMYSDGYEYKQTKFEQVTKDDPRPVLILKDFQDASPQSIFTWVEESSNEFTYIKTSDNLWTRQNTPEIFQLTDEQIFNTYSTLPTILLYMGLIYINYIPDYTFYPIECTILTKEFSGAGENLHNKKKYKEIQLKQIENYFLTKSELTWYVDEDESIYPYIWEQTVDKDNYYVSIKVNVDNYLLNAGSWVSESFYATTPGQPVPNDPDYSDIYRTKIGNQSEFNKRVKKGKKGYTTQIKLVNRETLPFGLKSLLLVYKMRKAK